MNFLRNFLIKSKIYDGNIKYGGKPERGVAFPDGSAADGQTLSGLGQHSDELITNCD
jgi:hypothetical protein